MESYYNTRIVYIQSLLIAFFADIRCINWGLTSGGFAGEGVMSILYIAIVGLIFVSTLFTLKKIKSSFSSYSIFLPIYLLVFYLITSVIVAAPVVSISYFLIFTIVAYLIPHITIVSSKLLLKAMMIFPSFAVLRLQAVFASSVSWATRLPMDVSYGYLIPIVANIVFLWFYFKDESRGAKLITLVFSGINFVFFLNILLFGSRGPILCIFLLLCFLWCIRINHFTGFKIDKRRLYILLFSGILIVAFFIPVMSYMNDRLFEYGIEVDAISKIINLQDAGDISNGRNDLNEKTWIGIINHPILGNGLDQYDNNYPGDDYPHNFILQILYDGGILLFLIFLPVFRKIPGYLKTCSRDDLAVFSVFSFASVPGALFSQDLWCIPVLWMFFGLMCSKYFTVRY